MLGQKALVGDVLSKGWKHVVHFKPQHTCDWLRFTHFLPRLCCLVLEVSMNAEGPPVLPVNTWCFSLLSLLNAEISKKRKVASAHGAEGASRCPFDPISSGLWWAWHGSGKLGQLRHKKKEEWSSEAPFNGTPPKMPPPISPDLLGSIWENGNCHWLSLSLMGIWEILFQTFECSYAVQTLQKR